MAQAEQPREPWFLKSNLPVLFPFHSALNLSEADFESFLRADLKAEQPAQESEVRSEDNSVGGDKDTFTVVSTPPSTSAEVRDALNHMDLDGALSDVAVDATDSAATATESALTGMGNNHPFMKGLLSHGIEAVPRAEDMENMMLTRNADVAHRSTKEALVDLFQELEEVVSGPRLLELLNSAWRDDPLATLKIIFNARSIHLGKSSRTSFYRCAGWLGLYHPLTLVANLRWLSRPVVEKKVEKKDGRAGGQEKDGDDEIVLVEDENDLTRFDVRNGVAHGYWKDLLNILALSANGKLDVLANPKDILNVERRSKPRGGFYRRRGEPASEKAKITAEGARAKRHEIRDERHDAAVNAFNSRPVHRALHLTIARLFAEQLKVDLAVLRGSDANAKRKISLCAKWAPSHARFHDKHTFVVSTIAELLYPISQFPTLGVEGASDDEKRAHYLRHARGKYTNDVADLRRHLEVVERNLSTNTLSDIKYERVPSLAMKNYIPIFATKDTDRFSTYIEDVAKGKARISGAVLLPSTLIHAVRTTGGYNGTKYSFKRPGTKVTPEAMVQAKIAEMQAKVLDGQWRTLVQRIRDSGALESSIAVCDTSGSMNSPTFPDGTCPLDSAVGLSLLLAEVTAPPFGGAIITFNERPTVEQFTVNSTLHEKWNRMSRLRWGMNTDFVAVFERLILRMAVKNKLAKDDMVKRVFVFSDMQFDRAQRGTERWSTSYERIRCMFENAGYDMPELVFWNLAGGRAGYGNNTENWAGDPVAPKPVTAAQEGTALVSGYSQGMLKVFMKNGSFDEPEEEEEEEELTETVEEGEGSDGEQEEETVVVEVQRKKKMKMDPMNVVRKAIGHKAYAMLKVLD